MVKMKNYCVIKFICRILLTKFYALYLSIFPHKKVDHLISQIGITSKVCFIFIHNMNVVFIKTIYLTSCYLGGSGNEYRMQYLIPLLLVSFCSLGRENGHQ